MKRPDHRQNESGRAQQAGPNPTPKPFWTGNPRHLRVLHALMTRAMPREQLDRIAGCANGPDLVSDLRHRGLELPCMRVPDFDRDGLPITRGVYHLAAADRRKVLRFFRGVRHG